MFIIVFTVIVIAALFLLLGFAKDGNRVVWKARPRQALALLG